MRIWKNVSLRIQLVSLYVVLLGASIVVVGIYSYSNTRRMLLDNTASRLRAQAKPVIEHWLYSRGQGAGTGNFKITSKKQPRTLANIAQCLARDLTSRDTIAVILDKRGKELANGKYLPEEPDPPPPEPFYYQQALAGDNEVNYISVCKGNRLLTLLIPLRASPTSDNIMGVVQLSTPLQEINRLLFEYGFMLLGVSTLVLFFGALAGLFLTGSVLKGLRRMADTCQRISEGDLSQRVNLPHYRDEIGKLASAFDNMVERIESTFEAQRRFVAKSAHELRTPLTALRGSLEVLLRGAQDDPAAVARLTHGMHREVLRLSRLCEQLLDLTKLDISTNIHKQAINLNEFFSNFIQQAKILAADRQVILKQGPFVNVLVDPDMLEQILFNLVHNAVQHTEKGGIITIGWKLVPDHVEIWVADNGEGIAPEDLPRIFEPFYQGRESGIRQEKGTGLGLTLTRSMVEAHGGKMTVRSKPGEGTVFSFVLPLT